MSWHPLETLSSEHKKELMDFALCTKLLNESQRIQQVDSQCQRQLVGLELLIIYRDRNTTTDLNLKALI